MRSHRVVMSLQGCANAFPSHEVLCIRTPRHCYDDLGNTWTSRLYAFAIYPSHYPEYSTSAGLYFHLHFTLSNSPSPPSFVSFGILGALTLYSQWLVQLSELSCVWRQRETTLSTSVPTDSPLDRHQMLLFSPPPINLGWTNNSVGDTSEFISSRTFSHRWRFQNCFPSQICY